MDLLQVQQALAAAKLDGWLLYDFRKNNDLACRFLGLGDECFLTRRFFYWIPCVGIPTKIIHAVEGHVLDHLPGKTVLYSSWQQLEACVKEALKGSHVVAMEYSAHNALPYVSKVDAGTIEMVRDCGVEVVGSADLLQPFLGVWNAEKLTQHREAAAVLDSAVEMAWAWIAQELRQGQVPTDYAVQQYILDLFHQAGCTTDAGPTCAINADSADPHYLPTAAGAKPIHKGDFILIDLWCKKDLLKAPYADICRVGVADSTPTHKQIEIFEIVKGARNQAIELVRTRFAAGQELRGWEVDQAARDVINQAGYGQFFTHRTGHNIDESGHGNGTHIDNFETHDTRLLLRNTCFSIEPGIYLPGEFGVRLEYDVVILPDGQVEITGGVQEQITVLFGA